MSEPRPDSRLADAKSPFLLHGATQPVDWWPWGPAVFEHARELDRPLLLDIGAVWCHWCHVMDRESYEDESTAALINELFVPVKVDRDERPDVDTRYQRAVQLLTGQGGWPLTAFLTPDGDVFYGGTYFPPTEAHGRPSFQRVLRELARVWREERGRAAEAAQGVVSRLETWSRTETEAGELSPGLLDDALDELAATFDFRYGGFGRAPKFPNAGALDLLLDRFVGQRTDWAGQIVRGTLSAMGRGGITDQLGGGIHRYSTDARWIIPHFEKMAYDNGPLLSTFAAAAAALDDPFYGDVAAGIVAHYRDVAPDLVDEGGFPASQDADFGFDNDGDYWTWTGDELREALDDAMDVAVASSAFGFDDAAGRMHIDTSRHVLFRARDDAAVADACEVDAGDVARRMASIRSRLKTARDRRPAPFVDRTVYTGWCALVASGHIAAARYLDMRDAGDAGVRALARIWREARDGSAVRHRLGDPDSGTFLDDQALVLLGLLDAFELTQHREWLDRATVLADGITSRFGDPASGALADRPAGSADVTVLDRTHVPLADSPTPSGNGAAALGLLRLAHLSGVSRFADAGSSVLRALAGSAARLHGAAATWMKALGWFAMPVTSVIIVDEERRPGADALLRAALSTYRPRTAVRRLAPDETGDAALPDAVRSMIGAASPRAYVCTGTTCALPVDAPADLARTLREFHP